MKLSGSLSGIDPHARTVTVIASTPDAVGGEALVSWDLDRFLKNPVVLWAHDNTAMPIGRASDVKTGPEGLSMKITFASAAANPVAEQVWQGVREEIVRAVSVGYEPGKSTEENGVKKVTNSELLEVSFVPVPADENAGTAAMREGTAGEMNASDAARALAQHRHRGTSVTAPVELETKSDALEVQRFDSGGKLGKVERTTLGGARVPARLSRTGVLTYRTSSGGSRRELRTASEVFRPDSLATLEDQPVIDLVHHTALVTPENYRDVARGHVKAVRQDGRFIDSELVIQDAATLDAIDRGERTEVSCGYVCRLDMTPGVYDGEPYDCVQRDIRYNHVALCPPNRGRAGPEVGLRLDATGNGAEAHFSEESKMTIKIRLDGTEYEEHSPAHFAKAAEMNAAALTAAKAETAVVQKKLDETEGRLDAKEKALKKAEDEATETKKRAKDEKEEDDKKVQSRINRAIRLLKRAARLERLFGKKDPDDDGDDDGDKDKEKMDATDPEFFSDRAIMLRAINAADPEFKADGKSDDYIASRFDAMEEQAKKAGGVDSVVHAVEKASDDLARMDATDMVQKAREKHHELTRNAWKQPFQGGNGASK